MFKVFCGLECVLKDPLAHFKNVHSSWGTRCSFTALGGQVSWAIQVHCVLAPCHLCCGGREVLASLWLKACCAHAVPLYPWVSLRAHPKGLPVRALLLVTSVPESCCLVFHVSSFSCKLCLCLGCWWNVVLCGVPPAFLWLSVLARRSWGIVPVICAAQVSVI